MKRMKQREQHRKLNSKMKKLCLVFLLVLGILMPTPVSAADNYIKNMKISCVLDKQGTGTFTEVWDMYVYSGTEVYKTFSNMHDQKITLLSVSDGSHTFKNIGDWDTDASKSAKTNKCGINATDDGYELCFGTGKYGHRIFTMKYKISHLVNQYKDTQGINYAFMGDMDLAVKKASVDLSTVKGSFKSGQDQIWGFGYEGRCDFLENGHIYMYATRLQRLQLLAKLKGTYSDPSTYHKSETFASVKKDAMEGADFSDEENDNVSYDYNGDITEDDDSEVTSLFSVFMFGVFVIAIFIIGISQVIGKSKKKFIFADGSKFDKNQVHPFRDLPTKDLDYFYYLAKACGLADDDEGGGLIAAHVLKWIDDHQVTFIQTAEKGFIRKKKSYQISFEKPLAVKSVAEQNLYNMFVKAAGKNRILETKEFGKYSRKHYQKILDYFDDVEKEVEDNLHAKGLLSTKKTYKKIIGLDIPVTRETYAMKVKEDMEHVYGLYLFLKDQDNMKEKEVIEVHLWNEYLMFATILGIADEVEKQLKIIQPHYGDVNEYGYSYYDVGYMTRAFAYASFSNAMSAYHSANSSSAFSGGGGGASFGGGGGGFSGGGGGGVR